MPVLSKFTKKMTDKMKEEAVREMACGKTGKVTAMQIKKNYGVDISAGRLYCIVGSNKYMEMYNTIQAGYKKKLADLSGIEIYAQRERMLDAEKIRRKTFKLLDKIDRKITTDLDNKDLSRYAQDYMVTLIKELRGLVSVHLKTLSYAKEEAKPTSSDEKKIQPSLVQYVDKQINVSSPEELIAKEKDDQVIDAAVAKITEAENEEIRKES